jgi:hypothetical protein
LSQVFSVAPLLHQKDLPHTVQHVKFLVVEIKLLLEEMKSDGGMHDEYVEMRNKMGN